jgi:hypothetical protein
MPLNERPLEARALESEQQPPSRWLFAFDGWGEGEQDDAFVLA